MGSTGHSWSIVLAGGDGRRLHCLTTDRQGVPVPKQYCSLRGGPTLLRSAVERAARVTDRSRIVVIVAAQHEGWWRAELADLAPRNIVIQPRNKGTAPGILLPLLAISARDPLAKIAVFPSDHFVADEGVIEAAVSSALSEIERDRRRLVLLGMTPDESDAQFGWIVPSDSSRRPVQPVGHFLEKPAASTAALLFDRGALWNSFIFATMASTLRARYERRLPLLLAALETALRQDCRASDVASQLALAYDSLDTIDFSRQLLQGPEDDLGVIPVAPCGWSDLGTAERVARCLEQMPRTARTPAHESLPSGAAMQLESALARA